MKTNQEIAEDQFEYLRENNSVCARGSVNGWPWLRYYPDADEWRVTAYGGPHRLSDRVRGRVLSEDKAESWLASNPVTMVPTQTAGDYRGGTSVWDDADEQDVFRDVDRCFWCGDSENSVSLRRFKTVEQGECHFCPDCQESWERADEIVAEAEYRSETHSA